MHFIELFSLRVNFELLCYDIIPEKFLSLDSIAEFSLLTCSLIFSSEYLYLSNSARFSS